MDKGIGMDGLALASVIGSSAVGLAGVTVGGLSTALDRRHQRLQAREARHQDRLERAYVKIIEYVRMTSVYLAGRWPLGEDVWVPPSGPPPSVPEHEAIAALVDAYGSPAVREAERQWWAAVRQALLKGRALERQDLSTGGVTVDQRILAHHAYLDIVHGPVRDQADRLIQLVNAELRHNPA